MSLQAEKARFEAGKKIYDQAVLTFHGVPGFDVYNPSIPFIWTGGTYLYARIEKRSEWARSWVRLFRQTGPDDWTVVPDSMIYQLEDPYISKIDDQLVMGGTHVRYSRGKIDTYYGYFYRGEKLDDMTYFTTGPDHMKDIRLVKMASGHIGVFSRPRHESSGPGARAADIGFTVIEDLDQLDAHIIEKAKPIDGLLQPEEWGSCNQCYLLDSHLIGVAGHKACRVVDEQTGKTNMLYTNIAFIFDPDHHQLETVKLIGTRSCYPAGPAKMPELADCAFTAGLVPRTDGRVDLYSGIGDTQVGRITIDNPFSGYGRIITPF
ncbi:MAG: DUF1861 family protein [Clostridiaceae bacterium]|nr:DUF1861 family protein [Clostridiaceae bacterium]